MHANNLLKFIILVKIYMFLLEASWASDFETTIVSMIEIQ
jgi:hypothetical protein